MPSRIICDVLIKPLAVFVVLAASAQAADSLAPLLKTVSTGPMQYYISLPSGWSAGKTWPVVMIIDSANRDFETAANVFAKARRDLPFILVTPMVITNGGARYREAPGYRYTTAAWSEIESAGGCRFDDQGLATVASDVHRLYGGEEKYFVTGFEAGGHTLFALLFQHPEALRGAAFVTPNFAGRCLDESSYSNSPARSTLPIRIFAGERDPGWKPGLPLFVQTQRAKDLAAQHGYGGISEAVIPTKSHEPLADDVLAYFYSLWKR